MSTAAGTRATGGRRRLPFCSSRSDARRILPPLVGTPSSLSVRKLSATQRGHEGLRGKQELAERAIRMVQFDRYRNETLIVHKGHCCKALYWQKTNADKAKQHCIQMSSITATILTDNVDNN